MKLGKLYAIVVRGPNGHTEILTHGRGYALMVFTRRSEAFSARVEEAGGDDSLLKAWKVVEFEPKGEVSTKTGPRKKDT